MTPILALISEATGADAILHLIGTQNDFIGGAIELQPSETAATCPEGHAETAALWVINQPAEPCPQCGITPYFLDPEYPDLTPLGIAPPAIRREDHPFG